MDRDIEQAADAVARGDATRPDLAMIEATATGLHGEVCDAASHPMEACDLLDFLSLARVAAAVIVPATAGHIAAAIEKMPDQEYTLAELKAEGFGDDLGVIYRDARGNAAARACSFAAGLSADATGGDSDE